MIELTKPFEVGKMYKRVDGVSVICTQVNNTNKGYETAQFSDFVEIHERTMSIIRKYESSLALAKQCDPDCEDSTKSGYRYNRHGDRGRCTGSPWDGYAVIPEPRDAEHVHKLFEYLKRSFQVEKMTDKTYTITLAQMKALFEAGSRSGESAACAYNCGSSYYGTDSDFVEAVEEFVNTGIKWGEPGYTEWATVAAMVKEV